MRTLLALILVAVAALAALPAAAGARTVTLEVRGMVCQLCPITVRMALEKMPGVEKAEVSLEHKTAIVTFDDAVTGVEALLDATKNAGFPSSLSLEPAER
jgi:mercuric ion binding protein